MTTNRQGYLDKAAELRAGYLSAIEGMDYCLDWKADDSAWSAREQIYHVIDTPPGGVGPLLSAITAGQVTEYDLWADRTNLTPERSEYDMARVKADLEGFFVSLEQAIGATAEEDFEGKSVLMHQRTRQIDEERTVGTVLDRTLNNHLADHLTQLKELRDSLGL